MSSPNGAASSHEDEDPYAILNVARTATRAEIKASYLRLARALHPDKRALGTGGAGHQREEDDLFGAVDRAWKLLSDETSRAVYDEFGSAGIQMLRQAELEREQRQASVASANRRIVPAKPVDARRATKLVGERLKRHEEKRNELKYPVQTLIRADVTAQDFTRFLTGLWSLEARRPYWTSPRGALRAVYPSLELMALQQNMVFIANNENVCIVSATGGTLRRGGGTSLPGELTTTWKHMDGLNTYDVATTFSAVEPPKLTLKGERSLSQYVVGGIEFVGDGRRDAGLGFNLSRPLIQDALQGDLFLGIGSLNGCKIGLRYLAFPSGERLGASREDDLEEEEDEEEVPLEDDYEDEADTSGLEPTTSASPTRRRAIQSSLKFDPFAGAVLTASWMETYRRGERLKGEIRLGGDGIFDVEVETAKYLGGRTTGAVAVSLGTSGVALRLRFLRGGSRFEMPILLASTPQLGVALVGGVVPGLLHALATQLLRPIAQRRRARWRHETEREVRAAKARALEQQGMLSAGAETRQREQSLKPDGVFVLKATYGAGGREDPDGLDVTIPLNFFLDTHSSVLKLKTGTKSSLLGFYNPTWNAKLEKRAGLRLWIRYAHAGRVYEVEFDDEQGVEIPGAPDARLVGNLVADPPVEWTS